MILQECKHNYAMNINKWYTDNTENHTCSQDIQFIIQKSQDYSWKRKSFKHWKSAAHVERMHSCRRLQSASLHMRKIILFKIIFIVEWFNWNDHKHWSVIDAISRHNYKKLSRISNNDRFNLYNKWHHKQIDKMQNQWENEKLLESFIDTDNYRSQSLQRVSVKIMLQLKNNKWREIY